MKPLALVVASFFFVLGLSVAYAATSVDVRIEVLKASRTQSGFDASARRYKKQLESMGFVGATTIDTLTAADRGVGSSVELRFRDPSRTERAIRVKVLESSKKRIRLHIEVPAYKLQTSTTHLDGGTYLMVIPKDDLVLAVQPR